MISQVREVSLSFLLVVELGRDATSDYETLTIMRNLLNFILISHIRFSCIFSFLVRQREGDILLRGECPQPYRTHAKDAPWYGTLLEL